MKFIKIKNFGNNLSFSLIEVLVFISILSVFFITAIAVVTASLRNMKINEHKILATRNAEELIEWLTAEKEADWQVFNSLTEESYCFNQALPASWNAPINPTIGDCSGYDGISGTSPQIFKREMVLSKPDPNRVDVEVTVYWQEPSKTYSVQLNKTFSVWE